MKTTAIEKYLKKHLSTCTMHRYSDGDNRKCSCGLDEARAELQAILAQLAAKDAMLAKALVAIRCNTDQQEAREYAATVYELIEAALKESEQE